VSKDRDGFEEEERLAPASDAGAGSADSTEPAKTDRLTASLSDAELAEAELADAKLADAGLADPESQAPDAEDIEAEIEAAEIDEGLEAGTSDDLDSERIEESELAVATAGSNRAAASRRGSSRVAATTAKKDAPTKPRDSPQRDGQISRLMRFLREVVAELRKVIWPSRKQMITYTVVVIVFLIIMVALVSGLDVLFHLVVEKVLG
jgi:preprotein translocase subunit SecE